MDDTQVREERYAALEIRRLRPYPSWQDPTALDLYRHLVATGAWWDLVDDAAVHLVGRLLRAHPAEVLQPNLARKEFFLRKAVGWLAGTTQCDRSSVSRIRPAGGRRAAAR